MHHLDEVIKRNVSSSIVVVNVHDLHEKWRISRDMFERLGRYGCIFCDDKKRIDISFYIFYLSNHPIQCPENLIDVEWRFRPAM